MVSKKIFKDITNYLLSNNDFSPVISSTIDSYPVDLSFTLENEKDYYSPKDCEGIPYRIYRSVGKQYNPTRIAAYALSHFNRYIDKGSDSDKIVFIKCANWFLDVPNARYEYDFDWGALKSPWISCMAQGEAASVLVRAYKLTANQRYLDHAERSLYPFFLSVADGGVQSTMADGSPFIEEYPSDNNTHVLNGFLYALIGLGEYIEVTGSHRHQELFDLLSASVCKNIKNWCYGRWSLYEDRKKAEGLNFCTPSYHNLQITQLKWLSKRVCSPVIELVIESWEKGLNSFWVRIFALFGKVYFRLKNKAQR